MTFFLARTLVLFEFAITDIGLTNISLALPMIGTNSSCSQHLYCCATERKCLVLSPHFLIYKSN